MVILLSQTTNVLQHLNISCFKCLKATSKKERDGVMDENNYTKPKKIDVNCIGRHNFGLVCVQKHHQV
jgi:hypothetical protein